MPNANLKVSSEYSIISSCKQYKLFSLHDTQSQTNVCAHTHTWGIDILWGHLPSPHKDMNTNAHSHMHPSSWRPPTQLSQLSLAR